MVVEVLFEKGVRSPVSTDGVEVLMTFFLFMSPVSFVGYQPLPEDNNIVLLVTRVVIKGKCFQIRVSYHNNENKIQPRRR